MICKKCGHRNRPMVAKCASCGQELGNNEHLAMFQAQAQLSKGVDVSLSQVIPAEQEAQNPASSEFKADDFFSDLPVESAPPPEPMVTPKAHRPAPAAPQVASFFTEAKVVEEPAFETDLGALRPEDERRGPAAHPLYSPPVNPAIEAFIARRAAARGKA